MIRSRLPVPSVAKATRPALVALSALGLAACAGLSFTKTELPICDGQSRRPANPHGSVLQEAATAPPLATRSPSANEVNHRTCGQ